MRMQELLLKMRNKRYQNAQMNVAQNRVALEHAQQKLYRAEQEIKIFDVQRRMKIYHIYNTLLGKKISRRKLDEARGMERTLNEKLASMKVEAKNYAHEVSEKKEQLSQAQSHLLYCHKGLEKAEEIYDLAVNENLHMEMRREDELIDEFAGRMKY